MLKQSNLQYLTSTEHVCQPKQTIPILEGTQEYKGIACCHMKENIVILNYHPEK